jgi:alkylation response protein AidB-like acyl-CoA dehydrogenase
VPIRKLTGEYGFNQTFFTDARIPDSCLIGREGGGWQVAMATLAFERGAVGGQAGGHAMMSKDVSQVVALARVAQRDGRPAIEDPLIRDRLVQFIMEEKSLSLNSARAKIKPLVAEWPGSIAMAGKLAATEYQRRLNQFALSLQGANAAYYVGDPNAYERGQWQRSYFNSFSGTIGGGTSEIQHNIIGERVLGLPKS